MRGPRAQPHEPPRRAHQLENLCEFFTPRGGQEFSFTNVDAAIAWMTAGKLAKRSEFDDIVDFMAVSGDQQAKFRMSEMLATGVFDPSEFATIAVLESHGSMDWGWYSETYSLINREEWWEDNVTTEDLLASWPKVSAEEIEQARVIFWAMRDVLDRRFKSDMDDAADERMHAAMMLSLAD